jgi:hypothetical protein
MDVTMTSMYVGLDRDQLDIDIYQECKDTPECIEEYPSESVILNSLINYYLRVEEESFGPPGRRLQPMES